MDVGQDPCTWLLLLLWHLTLDEALYEQQTLLSACGTTCCGCGCCCGAVAVVALLLCYCCCCLLLVTHLLGRLSTSGASLSASAAVKLPHAQAASVRAADRCMRKHPTTSEPTWGAAAAHTCGNSFKRPDAVHVPYVIPAGLRNVEALLHGSA